MKQIVLSLSLILSGLSFSQNIVKCFSHEAINYSAQQDATFMERYEQQFQEAKQRGANGSLAKTEYVIPVVVHVVYNKPSENLPDSVSNNQIRILNEDYSRMNADTVNLRSEFHPIAGSPKIRFVLVSRDPEGNYTSGITRTQTSLTSFMDIMAMITGDMSSLERIKSTANGGIDPWDQSKYLNIWVGNISLNLGGQEMTALLGYATPPANLPNWPANSTGGMSDGVVISHKVFGSNNPDPLTEQGYVVRGRTVTHEVGHYLGLRHIWGDATNCTEDDGVDDTPNATDKSESMSCDLTKNTCTDNIGTIGDLPDMVENFMDYSAETCQNSFTKGQADLMIGVLQGPRYDLVNDNEHLTAKVIDAITVSAYPNPTTDSFTMTFSKNPENLTVYDLNGKIVRTIENPHTTINVDLNGLQAGVYTVKFGTQLQNSHKIVKL
mgnify:FL=1